MADIFDFYVYDDRSIQFALAEPIMLEDKDVTEFRFRIPKVLNNIDMTDWEWWFIFVNAKKVKYTTQLTLEDDEDDPDNFSVATYTVGYGFSGYVGSVSFSIEAFNVLGENIVNEWHTRTYNTTVTDTLQGSRAVIPEPEGQSGTGLTEEIRQALLQIARKVAYIDEHGQTYYNDLYDALYAIQAVTVSPTRVGLTTIGATSQLIGATVPSGGTITWTSSDTSVATVSDTGLVTSVGYGTATITASSGGKVATCSVVVSQAELLYIEATYTQSGTVTDMDSLDSLKPDLVVTAYYDNQTSAVVTNYTLSGTLTEGTSTITVSYGGMTDTFDVTVVHQELPAGYTKYDYLTQTGFSDSFQAKAYGIWTNAQMSTDYTLEMKFFASSSAGSTGFDSPPLIGTRGGASGTKEIALFYKPKHNRLGYWFDGTDSTNQPPAPSKDVLHTIKIKPVGASATYPNNVTIDIDGTEYDTGSASTGKMFDSWFGIFTYAISSSMGITNNDVIFVGQQIGEILVTDSNGDAVYDFVPAKDSSDRYGYYEKVGGVFYYNATYATTNYIGGYWE